jgi:hypothetical protein
MSSSSISILGLETYARAIGTGGSKLATHGVGFNLALGVDILG